MNERQKKTALYILMMVMVINALAYGTIIPLLYPYAAKFGIGPQGLGFLFASFSIAQFISTPIIGRLSDKYGRKPLLLWCLLGTSLSLGLFAAAKTVTVLFIARIIDGITGGNNSVAQAMVADITDGKERAKAYGLLGAAFGFGFLAGPAIGGLLGQYGMTVPFWFGAIFGLIGTAVGVVFMPESLPKSARTAAHKEPFFRPSSLLTAIFAPGTGLVLFISFLAALAMNVFVLGFQTFTVDVLKLHTTQIGLLFATFGLVSMIMQVAGLKWLLNWVVSKKRILTLSLAVSAVVMALIAETNTLWMFAIVLFFHMVANAPAAPMINALLSERSRPEDQGGVMGLNQSYVSLGQVFGPLMAGWMAQSASVPMIFVLAAALFGFATLASAGLYIPIRKKLNL